MYSTESHCQYANNQLAEVICQLRFPEILSINTTVPAQFQEQIRAEFPIYKVTPETPAPKVISTQGNLQVQKQPTINNYQFSTPDGVWRVNLTSKFISLACTHYTNWDAFAKRLDAPLAAFIKTYKPAFFERIGLRYLNFISREELQLTDTPFRDLITPAYLGLLQETDVTEHQVHRCSVDAEMSINGGCHLKLHAGPGLVTQNGEQQKEIKFILDLDFFMSGNIPVHYSAGALKTLHSQAFPVFRDAITDTLHEAMDPQLS